MNCTYLLKRFKVFLSTNPLRDFTSDIGLMKLLSNYQVENLVAYCLWIRAFLIQLPSCLEASAEVLISSEGLNERFDIAVQL